MTPVQIAPSILAADFANLGAAVAQLEGSADLLHVDVMDGHFVPNLTIGPPVVSSLRKATQLPLDCHLMMTNPGEYFEAFKQAGATSCTIHVEIGDTAALIAKMRDVGLGAGLAVNPDGNYAMVEPFVADVDLLLCMSVFPGFGGQSFIVDVLQTVGDARADIDARGLATVIQIDGGIDLRTIGDAAAAGATNFVAGTAVFRQPDPAQAVQDLRVAAGEHG
ncbi:MAG TPA: ribulose-phosphate 3-epimerase [Acidimicrobiales bacterium]|nr:ribulose-phosphate 3-epimerase [Acidimicrobiales bacterium]